MNNKLGIVATLIAVLAVVLVVARPAKIEVNVPPVTVAPASEQLGSLASPLLPYSYFSVGGVLEHRFSASPKSATTTVCAFQSPATSTLRLGSGVKLNVSSTTASTVVFAKAASAFATTTFLFGAPVSANARATIVATTSTNDFVFNPGQWLVMSMQGGAGTFSPSGTCQATFEVFP